MKKTSLAVVVTIITLISATAYSQTVHGPSAKAAYSSMEEFSFGLGYHFTAFKDDWGWSRPAHNYYLEYIPEFKAVGLSANIQYTLIFVKAGFEGSFRSRNEKKDPYFTFFPHLGFELINLDLSMGPEFVSTPIDNKSMGFKIFVKVHPKLFNKGSNRLKLRKN